MSLRNELLVSPSWRSLSGSAVKYYLELRREFNGRNNGSLHLSYEQASQRLHMGSHTVARVQEELAEKGLIRLVSRGGYRQRVAATWALTDEAVPPIVATYEYRKWTPKSKPSLPKRQREHCRNDSDNVIDLASSLPKRQ